MIVVVFECRQTGDRIKGRRDEVLYGQLVVVVGILVLNHRLRTWRAGCKVHPERAN